MIEVILRTLGGSFERAPWGWGVLGTLWVALLIYGPRWNKQIADAQAQKRAEQLDVDKEGRSDLRDRIIALEALVRDQGQKIESLQAKANDYQMKLVSALAAFRLLAGEIEKTDPKNPVLKQATDLIGMASTGDMGMGKVVDELSRLPATMREGKA